MLRIKRQCYQCPDIGIFILIEIRKSQVVVSIIVESMIMVILNLK